VSYVLQHYNIARSMMMHVVFTYACMSLVDSSMEPAALLACKRGSKGGALLACISPPLLPLL